MKLQVRADQYAFRLYRPGGELPETLPEHRVDGHRCVGHYTTLADLIRGARQLLLKDKAKRAVDLRAFLERAGEVDASSVRALEDLADAAMKLEVRP